MLEIVQAYLEAYSVQIFDVRHLKRNGKPVITIDGKMPEGNVATFQLRGNTLYRQRFNHKSREFVTIELIYQFTEIK